MENEEDLSNYYSFLKNIKRLGERSIFEYVKQYRRLKSLSLTQESVNQYIADCKNTDVARGFMKSYLIFRNLHKTIDLPPRPSGTEKKRLFRPIPPEEWKSFIAYVYSKNFKDGILFELIYQGALRRVEVPTIKVNSFHWNEWFDNMDGFCKLNVIGKGDKERTVLVNSETAEKIFTHFHNKFNLDDAEKLKTFINSDSRLFGLQDNQERKVNDFLNKYSLKFFSGKRNIRPHELRHQRATELLGRGIPPHDIKNYLGHSSISTTEKYIHQKEEESISNIQNILS